VLLSPIAGFGQIAFFNMPNPDMLPAVGYAYAELDQYQSLKGNRSVNATVARISIQPIKFLEIGANFWFNEDHPGDPNRTVLATKWKIDVYQKHPISVTISPGSWTSIYHDSEVPIKNLLYGFVGVNHEEGPKAYTRLMFGGYAKYQSGNPNQYGIIAGFEHRFSDKLEFVTDYFQGTGEGFGLATGIVFYAAEKGHNMPIYLAYQFDNEGRQNDVLIIQIGWFFNMFGKLAMPGSSPGARSTKLERSFPGRASARTTP
jgi:hypothetical protein